jgi:hypothetical protein
MDVLYSFPEGAAERLAPLFSRSKRLPSIWVSKVSGSGSQARSRLRVPLSFVCRLENRASRLWKPSGTASGLTDPALWSSSAPSRQLFRYAEPEDSIT